MLRSWGLGFAVCAVACSSAQASDVWSSHAAQANWSGIYIGVNGGYAWNDGDLSNITVVNSGGIPYATGPLGYNIDLDGKFGGGQVGYNADLGSLVIGVEADIQASGIDGSSSADFAPPAVFPFTYSASTDVNWFGTLRGRIGVNCGTTLIFFTGGYAFGDIDYDATYLIPRNGAFAKLHKGGMQDGYVLGGGIERQLDSTWSLKVEYQYLNFGEEDVSGALLFASGEPSGETVKTNYDVDLQTIRVGLNYRFGNEAPSVTPLK